MTYDPRYLQGIEYFNDCEFFEAHEVWEELWADTQGEPRKFFQGLIQVAVCLHHFGNGNINGARKLYHSSTKYLQNYGDFYEGLNVKKLCGELETCCREILENDEPFAKIALVPDLIPEIHLEEA